MVDNKKLLRLYEQAAKLKEVSSERENKYDLEIMTTSDQVTATLIIRSDLSTQRKELVYIWLYDRTGNLQALLFDSVPMLADDAIDMTISIVDALIIALKKGDVYE